jgi:hypothetical protein
MITCSEFHQALFEMKEIFISKCFFLFTTKWFLIWNLNDLNVLLPSSFTHLIPCWMFVIYCRSLSSHFRI